MKRCLHPERSNDPLATTSLPLDFKNKPLEHFQGH